MIGSLGKIRGEAQSKNGEEKRKALDVGHDWKNEAPARSKDFLQIRRDEDKKR